MQAPLPPDEETRLKALRDYEILDTDPEQEFDDITLLASQICGTPIALISLIDEKRQWFKSRVGVIGSETSREIAFCAHGILQAELFVVNDARVDHRFADNPMVTGNPKIRFYAGAPLITASGQALGMLCVSDRVPRKLTAGQKSALEALGRQVVVLLEARRRMTELRQAVAERRRLEAQTYQSQKLETVGKLAGGIAHEFNSILTTIIGQSEILLSELPAGSPLATSASEISKAAGRAAGLTRQLLAYGRKQMLQPEILDLNQVITGMEGMLRHLMGGAVDTRMLPGSGLQTVKADAGQIEQVIMNLAINARDAMPNGGKLTLETANLAFEKESVKGHPELKPGDYVMLAITDTGMGMSAEAKARIFEPFFSTKGVGQGTGLGLSTSYGIVKQSGGHLTVYSEPGRGTVCKIFLPQAKPQVKATLPPLEAKALPRGAETILLVEDDPALREMAAMLLTRLGYEILSAANGSGALSLKPQSGIGHIDLLFTDLILPDMSGGELWERLRLLYPQTRILFTSADTGNAIYAQGAPDPGPALLQKPFTPAALARKLREVLDQPSSAEAGSAPKLFGIAGIPDELATPAN